MQEDRCWELPLQSKEGPDLESIDCGSETLKGKPPLGSACNIGMWTAGAWGVMLASHMCRFEDELLLSSSLSLRMIEQFVDRSNFRASRPVDLSGGGKSIVRGTL